MNTDKVTMVYFSPTGSTKKILQGIIEGVQTSVVRHFDLTLPPAQTQDFKMRQDDFAVIGAPVYTGRIPGIVVQRLKQIKADKTPAVIVVVYGNRAYEDALLELSDLVIEAGFIPVAAGAFIGEHSFSSMTTPIAARRPDAQDLMQARDFGAMVVKKMGEMQRLDATVALSLPGNFPYKAPIALPEMSPLIREALCNLCGECAVVCPTAAITVDKTVLIDKKQCVLCCACVKSCPIDACVMDEPLMKQVAQWLSKTFQERKAPEIFA